MTRRWIIAVFSLLVLGGCGTEVGNGLKPDKKRPKRPGEDVGERATSAETAPDWTYFLFAPCASPFSEAIATRYQNDEVVIQTQTQGDIITVTLQRAPFATTTAANGTIGRASDTDFAFDIRHINASALLPTIATATCDIVTSNTTQDASGGLTVVRDVAVTFLGVQARVTWTLAGPTPGSVRTMGVTLNGSTHTLTAP